MHIKYFNDSEVEFNGPYVKLPINDLLKDKREIYYLIFVFYDKLEIERAHLFEVYLPQILGDNSIDFSDHDYEHINALDLFLNRVINEKFSKETSFADYGNNFILEIVNNSCSLKLKLFRDCYLEFNNITLDSIKLFYADYHHNLIEYGKGRFDDRSDLGKSIYMICDDRDTYSMEEIEQYLEELRQDYLKKSDDELYTLAFTYPHIKRLLIDLGIFKNNKIIR